MSKIFDIEEVKKSKLPKNPETWKTKDMGSFLEIVKRSALKTKFSTKRKILKYTCHYFF